MSALVSAEWLAEYLDAPDIRVVDATWFLPTLKRNPKAEFEEAHIKGSVYFDIDDIADDDSPYRTCCRMPPNSRRGLANWVLVMAIVLSFTITIVFARALERVDVSAFWT